MARQTLTALSTLPLLLLTACNSGGRSAGVDAVFIGSSKAGYFGPPAEYRALQMQLEKQFNKAVQFKDQPSGDALAQQLALGNIDFAILTAAEYATVPDSSPLELLASGVNPAGRTSRKGLIVTKADSDHIKSLAECAKKRFAFGIFGDAVTDFAAQQALADAGVPVKDLLPEVLPPPLALFGRLYLGKDVPRTIVSDITVNAGVIDEIAFAALPEEGAGLLTIITGAAKKQIRTLGETPAVPEVVVVAGPHSDPDRQRKLTEYLLNEAKNDKMLCEQMGITGFAAPNQAEYNEARRWLRNYVNQPSADTALVETPASAPADATASGQGQAN